MFNMDMALGSFNSKDGTQIGFFRLGSGPALVIVHGSLSNGESWREVASLLAGSFTCYVIDRRGRGRSGDAPHYAIEREYEDIQGALTMSGEGANLLGHSFGAVCALGAALRTPVPRLILYEPPLPVGGPVAGPYLVDYQNAIDDGDFDRALEIGYTRFAAIPVSRIPSMRTTPDWAQAKALAPTWTREIEEIEKLGPSLDRYRTLSAPTLLLLGSESAPHPLKDTTEALSRTLAQARVSELSGQGHIANLRTPGLVAGRVRAFLRE